MNTVGTRSNSCKYARTAMQLKYVVDIYCGMFGDKNEI